MPQFLYTCHDPKTFCDLNFPFLTDFIILLSLFLFLSFFFLLLCLFMMDKRKCVFPGNLLYLQSSDMAARPLLINSPLNFNRLIINYWGINVQIQLCCPSSVHKCQQRYFMACAVGHSDSQSPLTLTSQLCQAENRIFFQSKRTNWMRQKQKYEMKNNFLVHGNILIFLI